MRALLNKPVIGLSASYLYKFNTILRYNNPLNLIVPPHQIISGATPALAGAPLSVFTLTAINTIFGWDSSLRTEPENQFWNDVVSTGSSYLFHFISTMATM